MKTPVILDTDIGDDIDDTWALVMLLKSPQFDVKLVTTTHGQAEYRARLAAKLLTVAGRTDVPVGLGAGEPAGVGKIAPWIDDFPLSSYRGTIHRDGVQALIDAVHRSPEPITIIAIGPLDTLSAALEKDPSIAPKARFVGMQGSVYKGYSGSSVAQPEFNVKSSVAAAQRVFSAPWRSIAITPLDTCGVPDMKLSGERFQSLKNCDDARVAAILESYRIWSKSADLNAMNESTILYDTVAVYLADPSGAPLLQCDELKIAVTGDGITAITGAGRPMRVATRWKDLEAYRNYVLHVLVAPQDGDLRTGNYGESPHTR